MRHAKIYLTGKTFEGCFHLESIKNVRNFLLDELKKRGVLVSRQAVFLAKERFHVAPLFLMAGFEVLPADEESFQLALSCSFDLQSPVPPDELVLSFGPDVPERILSFLYERVPVTFLHRGPLPTDFREPFASEFDIAPLLVDGAVQPTTETGTSVPPAPLAPSPSPVNVPISGITEEPTGKMASEKEPEPVAESPRTTPVIPEKEIGTEPATPPVPPTSDLSETTGETASKKEPEPEPETVVKPAPVPPASLSDAGIGLIQRFVKENDGKIRLTKLIELLKPDFPDPFQLLNEAYLAEHLPSVADTLKVITEDNGEKFVYASDHPDLTVVSNAEAIKKINIKSGGNDPTPPPYIPEYHFEIISEKAALLKDYCRWIAQQRQKKKTSLSHRSKSDFEKAAANLSFFLWPDTIETSDDNRKMMADCYEALEVAARLMDGHLNERLINPPPIREIAQYYANAVCLLKSALLEIGFELNDDDLQRDAFEEIDKFAERRRVFLDNLKIDSRIPIKERKDMKSQLLLIEKKLTTPRDSGKERKSLEKRIEYHLDNKIKGNPPGDPHDWKIAIEGISSLMNDYNVPVSTVANRFKKFLLPLIGKVPEEVDQPDQFIKLVQNIEVGEEQPAKTSPISQQRLSESVRAVRKRYKGKKGEMSKLVFIGGTPVEHVSKRIQESFQMEVLWEESSHGDSLTRFQSVLNDEKVKLILAYIPWCSHKHSEDFAGIARKAGKDFVRVPKGTNPESIANAICKQIMKQ